MALPNSNSLMERIETTILRNLVFNEEYSRKVIPFIKSEYFTDDIMKQLDAVAKQQFSYGTN